MYQSKISRNILYSTMARGISKYAGQKQTIGRGKAQIEKWRNEDSNMLAQEIKKVSILELELQKLFHENKQWSEAYRQLQVQLQNQVWQKKYRTLNA